MALLAIASLLLFFVPTATVGAEARPSVTTDRAVYESGERITVNWSNAAGNPRDWVGLYPSFSDEPGETAATLWDYLDQGDGETVVTDGSLTWSASRPGQRDSWPLPPGDYTIYLLVDDGYEFLDSTTIRVTGDAGGEPLPESEWPANPDDARLARTLKVMTFNIWLGGDEVDFGSIVRGVRKADADVVGVQEPGANLQRLARRLGWKHVFSSADGYTNIISRYRLVAPRGTDEFAWLTLPNGGRIAMSSVHLTAYPYGPYDLRDGASVRYVLFNEENHIQEMRSRIGALSAVAETGVPVMLVGDFNSPSHLDWTTRATEARQDNGEEFVRPVPWPVSIQLADNGFRDSFRTVHPNVVRTPGYTWTPGYPPPTVTDDEVFDRIDQIFVNGPVKTVSSKVVGESRRNAAIVVRPWGSDHRAVVSKVRLQPS